MVAMSAAGHVAVAARARPLRGRARLPAARHASSRARRDRRCGAPRRCASRARVPRGRSRPRRGRRGRAAGVLGERFGWDVETAERVLWECDVPAKGALSVADAIAAVEPLSADATRVMDAADARRLWVPRFPRLRRPGVAGRGVDVARRVGRDARRALQARSPDAARRDAGEGAPRSAHRRTRAPTRKNTNAPWRHVAAVASPAVRHGRRRVLRAHEESEETETVRACCRGRAGTTTREASTRQAGGVWCLGESSRRKKKNETAFGRRPDAAATCARGAGRVEARCVWLP